MENESYLDYYFPFLKKYFRTEEPVNRNIIRNLQEFNDINYERPFSPTIILTKDNAKVQLMVQEEIWDKDAGYDIVPFTSQVRIAALYKHTNKEENPAPKGLTRRLLCIALQKLLNDNEITNKSIIVLEADPSINNDLITKVYKPINFELLAHGDGIKYNNRNTNTYNRGKGGLMKSTVGKTLKWCDENM